MLKIKMTTLSYKYQNIDNQNIKLRTKIKNQEYV